MAIGIVNMVYRYIKLRTIQRTFSLIVLLLLLINSPTFSKTAPDFGIKTVVIDAGHGGHDVGCLGASSREKDVALAIALKLGEAIKKNYRDVKVVYTRKTDVFVTLEDRAKIANENNADLFICVHANANDNKSAYGTETFVMGLHKSDANLNVAKRENSSILMEENYETTYEGFDPNSDESYIALSLMQSTFLSQSLVFASKTQKQFEKIGRKNRGVKQAGFLVLYRTTMPSVLIETGFLTNKEEEKFLKNPQNQTKMANSIFNAFKEYKEEIEGVEIKKEKGTTQNVDPPKKNITKKPDITVKEESNGSEVVYRVQITSSSKKIPLTSSNFKGLKNIWEYQQNGMYKYAVGGYKNIEQANELQAEARKKGYKDAFIVAFYKGNRISMAKAKELKPIN